MTIKKCRDCQVDKPTSEFWKQRKNYLQSYCKPCSAQRAKKFQVHVATWDRSPIVCDFCSKTFMPKRKHQKRCSAKCGYSFQNKKISRKEVNLGNCLRCNKSLSSKRVKAIYCSKSCGSMDHTFKKRGNTRTTSTSRRYEIYLRDGGRCYICEHPTTDKEFELDHLVPVSRNGTSESHNLAVSCRGCNRSRGTTIGIRQLQKLFELRPRV